MELLRRKKGKDSTPLRTAFAIYPEASRSTPGLQVQYADVDYVKVITVTWKQDPPTFEAFSLTQDILKDSLYNFVSYWERLLQSCTIPPCGGTLGVGSVQSGVAFFTHNGSKPVKHTYLEYEHLHNLVRSLEFSAGCRGCLPFRLVCLTTQSLLT
jgi:hypothetical protein